VTGVNKGLSSNRFNMYPNPAQSKIIIQLSSNETSDIIMYNVLGNEVKHLATNQLQSEINVSNLVSGVYFVKVIQEEKATTQKIVIQR
jgi:hypothetical protein